MGSEPGQALRSQGLSKVFPSLGFIFQRGHMAQVECVPLHLCNLSPRTVSPPPPPPQSP